MKKMHALNIFLGAFRSGATCALFAFFFAHGVEAADFMSSPGMGDSFAASSGFGQWIQKYSLMDIRCHAKALQLADSLADKAKDLDRQGKLQINSEDFRSRLDGSVTSREGVRRQGAMNINRAKEINAEVAGIREGIKQVLDDLEKKAQLPGAQKIYDLGGLNGSIIRAQVVENNGDYLTIKLTDGRFFGITLAQLNPKTIESLKTTALTPDNTEVANDTNQNVQSAVLVADAKGNSGAVVAEVAPHPLLESGNSSATVGVGGARVKIPSLIQEPRSNSSLDRCLASIAIPSEYEMQIVRNSHWSGDMDEGA